MTTTHGETTAEPIWTTTRVPRDELTEATAESDAENRDQTTLDSPDADTDSSPILTQTRAP